MGFAASMTLKTVVVLGFICLRYVKDTHAQLQNPVIALEASEVDLTIVIPNNQLANAASFITIRLDNGYGLNLTDILYLVQGGPRVPDAYANKLTATQTNKRLQLRFRSVTAADAGTFRCYVQSGLTIINDCGQLLIVIRKPNPPTVKMLPSSSAIVGSRLELLCETHSNSLPPNHGLTSEIWWYDQSGQSYGPAGSNQRVRVNTQSQLIIEPLDRADKGRQFYCISADNAGDVARRIQSDKSALFEVIPEYKPSLQDFKLNPVFQNGDVIKQPIGERITYRCDVDCWPQCDIMWMYKPNAGSQEFVEVMNLVDKKVLTWEVNRTNEGSYQCKAENKHGTFVQGFTLQPLYMDAPVVNINGEQKSTAKVLEDVPVILKCIFDSNPAPVVNWISPSQSMLLTQKAVGPEVVMEGGVTKRLYTSTYSVSKLKCEDTGIYRCEGKNEIHTGEGRMELVITCPPSSADIPGLELKEEYVWKISQPLNFQFVIRAFPEPNITQIVSSNNGVLQKEELRKDIDIIRMPNYDGKPYLTKFDLTSRRNLDQSDTDRVYTMTVQSSEFKKDFIFQIHPRGPPHEVVNLTAVDIDHDSLILFWLPGFNGGEPQTFSVEYRVRNPSELESGIQQNQQDFHSWTIALANIQDEVSSNWIEVTVGSLRSSTDYVIRVKATNALGSSVAEIKVKTAAPPGESLSAGAIVGIVFGVLIILAIIALAFYFLVWRKKFRKNRGHMGETRKSIIPERITALFTKNNYNTRQRADGHAKPNGSTPKESPWARVRKHFKRSPSRNSLDYINIPPKDYIDPVSYEYGNHEDGETGNYINTGLYSRPAENSHDTEFTLNNNAVGTKTPDSGRKMNEEGLVYVEVEFPDDKNKNKKGKDKKKKKKKKNDDIYRSNDSVNYSDIDFSVTAAKRKEVEEAEKKEQEELLDKDDENASRQNKYADAGYGIGTTV